MGMARSMMKAKMLPGWFWGEAVNTVVFLLNRAPTQSVDGKTPYEVWHGVKPLVHFLCTFVCVAHVKNGGQRLAKLDDRSTPMVFVGYEAGSKAYRFYNPVSRPFTCRTTPCSRRSGAGIGEPTGEPDPTTTSSRSRWSTSSWRRLGREALPLHHVLHRVLH
jgi:hypothetical protein